MTIRSLSSDLRSFLRDNNDISYAHLIKFEKPSLSDISYTYLTDASSNIEWDGETYYANKVLKVGDITESTAARASSVSIDISAIALGTRVDVTLETYTGSSFSFNKDLIELGFSEGDYIEIAQGPSIAKGQIRAFSNENKTIDFDIKTTSGLFVPYDGVVLSLISEEVVGPLAERSSASYANYINREIYVYKAFFNEEGETQGEPLLIFKGIITSSKIKEDIFKGSVVSWVTSSHWGDFVRVNGRITSDNLHRNLKDDGTPDYETLVKKEYGNDLGFEHAERALNVVAVYQVSETKTRTKVKKKLGGLRTKVKVEEYEEIVDRETDLRFNISAKSLPVVYGVQRINTIPIFADTLKNDSSTVFLAYALCEGEIGGVYDIYLDDKNSICLDASDNAARSQQTSENTIDVLCKGRMDRGDILDARNPPGTTTFRNGTTTSIRGRGDRAEGDYGRGASAQYRSDRGPGWQPGQTDTGTTSPSEENPSANPLVHERSIKLSVGNMPIEMTLHTGKRFQKADALLSSTAAANNFKVQTDYYSSPGDYWGANHRLLDTAYVTAQYKIVEGETTIPSADFIVRGKLIECYNYDFEYVVAAYENDWTQAKWDQLELGTVYQGAKLLDKRVLQNEDGIREYRLRFESAPTFTNGTASINSITIEKYDRIIASGSALQNYPDTVVQSVTDNTETQQTTIGVNNPNIDLTLIDEDFWNFGIEGAGIGSVGVIDVTAIGGGIVNITIPSLPVSIPTSNIIPPNSILKAKGQVLIPTEIQNPSSIANNYKLKVYKDSEGFEDFRSITSVNPGNGYTLVTVDLDFDRDIDNTYSWAIVSEGDYRVSLNPAVQLVDYLTSDRYGRGLNVNRDLNVQEFQKAAQQCDTRSDVTIVSSSQPSIGSIYYRGNSTDRSYFEGRVASTTQRTFQGSTYYEIVLTDVIGKLGRKWRDWKYMYAGELVWSAGNVYEVAGSGPINSLSGATPLTSVSLTKKGGGSLSLNLSFSSFDGNPLVKSWTNSTEGFSLSGYSLYDCDDVKYWRYLGWNSQDQREVTRHQLNTIIDTAAPVFENINSLLAQFNGMLRYDAGKYALSIKTAASVDSSANLLDDEGNTLISGDESIRVIQEEDIIGTINVEDAGVKGSYNTISLSIPDPQNRFDDRSVSYFNSTYLKEDRNIPKKADLKIGDITNFYNARINAKQYLEESRYSLNISFTLPPSAIDLVAGEIISITHSRLGWDKKLFRVNNLTFQQNCLVKVSAEEHNQEAFIINKAAVGPGNITATPAAFPRPGAPSNLGAIPDTAGGIILEWDNNEAFNSSTWSTQIWRVVPVEGINFLNEENTEEQNELLWTDYAELIAEVPTNNVGKETYTDMFPTTEEVERYYRVRHKQMRINRSGISKVTLSNFEPPFASIPVFGEAEAARGINARTITLTPTKQVFLYNSLGDLLTPGDSVNFVISHLAGFANPYYKLTVNDDPVVDWTAISDTDEDGLLTDEVIHTLAANPEYSETVYKVEVFVREGEAGEIEAQDVVTIYNLRRGSDAVTVILSNETHAISVTAEGDLDTDSLALSGTDITVYIGAAKLTYDEGLSQNLTWYISSLSPEGVTYNDSGSDRWKVDEVNNKIVTVDPISGFSDNTVFAGQTTFNIEIKGRDGEDISVSKIQTFGSARSGVVGADGRTVSIAGPTAIKFNNATTPAIIGSNIKNYTAKAFNTSDSVDIYYQFFINGTSLSENPESPSGDVQTEFTKAIALPTGFINYPIELSVEIREGAQDSSVVATDAQTIVAVKDGANTITVDMVNDAHVVHRNNQGSLDMTGSGVEIRVFEGATLLTPVSENPTNGQYTVTVDVNTDGSIVLDTNYPADISGNVWFISQYSTDSFGGATGTDSIGFVYFTIEGKTSLGESFTRRRVQSLTVATDGENAPDILVGVLTNENIVISADKDGGVSDFTGVDAGRLSLYYGDNNVSESADSSFSIQKGNNAPASIITANNLTLSVSNLGVLSIAQTGTGWSSNTESFTIIGSYDNQTVSKILTISKAKAGEDGTAAKLVRLILEQTAIVYDTAGDNPNPATIKLAADIQGFVGTPTIQYVNETTGVGLPLNTDDNTADYGAPTSFSTGSDKIALKVTDENGTVYIDTQSIIRVKDAQDGRSNAIVYAYKASETAPQDNPGDIQIDLDTGLINTESLANNWYKSPPLASGSEVIWVTAISGSGTENTVDVSAGSWSAPIQFSGSSANSLNQSLDLKKSSSIVLGPNLQTISKVSGGSGWNAQVYSNIGYTSGAYVTFSPGQTSKDIFMGLDSSPASSSSYNSIDYSWYLKSNGKAFPYYAGNILGSTEVSYTSSTIFSIIYDGQQVRYYSNGVLQETYQPSTANLTLYLDSSFYTEGNNLITNFSFGPSGSSGVNSATVLLRKRNNSATTAPGLPSAPLVYNFKTKRFTNPEDLNDWTLDAPPTNQGEYVWETRATAAAPATITTDTIEASEWSAAVRLTGDKGLGVSLSASPSVISYNDDGSTPNPPNYTLTASAGGFDNPQYSFNGAAYTNTNTRTVASPSTFSPGTPITHTVSVREINDPSRAITASVSIARSKPGQDGRDSVVPGEDGKPAPRVASGIVYFSLQTTQAPGTPKKSNSQYNFNNGTFSNLQTYIRDGQTGGWSIEPPTLAAGESGAYYAASFTAIEILDAQGNLTGFASGDNLSFGTPTPGVVFSGLVTFVGDDLLNDQGSVIPVLKNGSEAIAAINNAPNTTTINGGKIRTNSISARELAISNDTSTGAGVFVDGTNKRIIISDNSGIRVVLGNLSNI